MILRENSTNKQKKRHRA